MNIVVELQSGKGLRVKSDWMYFRAVWRYNQENGSEGVVRGVSFKDDLCIWNPMSQYWSGGERFFECFEGFPAFQGEISNKPFSSQTCEQNRYIRVVKNEFLINISESEKGLNVLDFAQFGPFLDACSQGTPQSWCGSCNYWCGHRGDFSEASEDLTDMFVVLFHVV